MKIDKKEFIITIVMFLSFNVVLWIFYFISMNKPKAWPWIIVSVIISIAIISRHFIKISEETKEKITNIFIGLGTILSALITYEGVFLGIKFHNPLLYLIAVVGLYILMKLAFRLRKKILNMNRSIERTVTKRLENRRNN